jgi:folate-dependent phosphoribosylglycinamide formyltransferase PurN
MLAFRLFGMHADVHLLPVNCCFTCRRFSGPTVHFVDEEYDTGPILAQRCVQVFPTDSPKQLAARVLEQVRQVAGLVFSYTCSSCAARNSAGCQQLYELASSCCLLRAR